MEIREAPLDNKVVSNNCNTYMVTVNVSPKKYVNNHKWMNLTQVYQANCLLKHLKQCEEMFYIFDVTHRIELTKAGYSHLHFVCSTDEINIEAVQASFHKKFGMPNLEPSVCCMVTRTIKDITHAIAYVTKEDSEVPNQNMFLDHKK